MQKLSQTEELARTLAARARHHALTPEQISRAMDEQDYDVRSWTSCIRHWRTAACT